MSSWFVVYIIICAANALMIREWAGLTPGDIRAWLWILIPIIAQVCGAKIGKGE